MIDVENQIFTKVYDALAATEWDVDCKSDLSQIPSHFPCVYIVEADNYTHTASIDSASNENNVNVMYEVHCYANDAQGKKSKCKAVYAVVDETLLNLGFTRLSRTSLTQNDATVYRLVGRYTAVISKNNVIYRR